MSPDFDPAGLEARFEPIERLPRGLWLPAIVNTEGEPVARLKELAAARERLIAGGAVIDPGADWPRPDAAFAFAAVCDRLAIGELASGSAEVADQVLRSLLWHLDRIALAQARLSRAAAIDACAAEFNDDWALRTMELREVLRVFDSLDGIANFARWSEIRGLLESQGWQEVLAARERIARMPRLAGLIRRLGRARAARDEVPTEVALERASAQTPEWVRRVLEVELPGAAIEIEGVRRSGDFTRMLASEAILLRGRRRLLAARIAEQTLLSYRHRETSNDTAWERRPGAARIARTVPRPEMVCGPMILCVDTSASMRGAPEQIAKAIVLEAMRAAGAQRRGCLLFAFSGPGELCEFDLGAHVDGLASLAGFLQRSFHGGTDVCEPFEHALAAIESKRWRAADLLIASDGEFGAPASLVARMAQARHQFGLRVQAVLIGDRETIGMRQVSDDVFWVRDWRRYGAHTEAEPPVHASDLTARYFPSAFIGRGAGAGT